MEIHSGKPCEKREYYYYYDDHSCVLFLSASVVNAFEVFSRQGITTGMLLKAK